MTLSPESMGWLAALKRAGIEHFPGFAVGAWSPILCLALKLKLKSKVESRI
jgi:hypothetical protein